MAPYHHGDLRNALVAAALARVEAKGADAFSLREAAKDVGVSANAAYRHFAAKDALLTAVAARGFGALSAKMAEAIAALPVEANTGEGQLRAVGRAYVVFAHARPHLFQLMFTDHGAACFAIEHTAQGPTPGELLTQVIDRLAAVGGVAPERRVGAALNLWVAAHGFAMLALNGPTSGWDELTREQAFEGVLDLLVAGLRAPTARGGEMPNLDLGPPTPERGA